MTPGVLLKAYRERDGLTQRELADRSGVSLAAIRDLEQGRSRRPRRDSVHALARALDLTGPEERRLRAGAHTPPVLAPVPAAPAAPAVALGVLGPLTVWHSGVPAPLNAAKPRVLLLRLALTAGEAVGREELADLLWGERRPDSAANLLSTYIGRLRRLLEPGPDAPLMLSGTLGGYRLTAGPAVLDLAQLRALASRAAAEPDPKRAFHLLAAAARLWRGETDVDELRHGPLMAALIEEYATLLCALSRAARRLGECEPVLPPLRALASRLELHEPLHAELVAALAAAGRRTEALAAYERIRGALADQLGIDPGGLLREARRAVLRPVAAR